MSDNLVGCWKDLEQMWRRLIVGVIILVVAAYGLGTAGIYYTLMSQRVAAVWDFYPLWFGARVLLLERRDPYDPQVTLDIQQALYGHPALPSEDRSAFYYPLPMVLLVTPFALLPYPLGAAAWLCLLLFAVVGAVGATLWGVAWRAPPLGAAALVLWTLALFPVVWSVLLGRVAVLLLLPMSLGLAAVLHKRDRLAGVCLALSKLKPQLTCLLLPMIGVWAIVHRRWRLLVAFLSTIVALGMVSLLLLPEWPARFATSAGAYATAHPFAALLQVLLEGWLGLQVSWLWVAVGIPLLGGCLAFWLRAQEEPRHLAQVAGATLVVSALVIPHVGMVNQLILLWPALLVASRLWLRSGWRRVMAVGLLVAMVTVPWAFAATMTITPGVHRHEVEHQTLAPFLPLLLGSALGIQRYFERWTGGGDKGSQGV